ncbi:MAG: mandelate racemase/muconate lactonizing enzyme family protein [Halobacteriaceae archaeon]
MRTVVEPFAVALDAPLTTARGEIAERRGFLLRLGDDPTGLGEATPLTGWTEGYDACREALDAATAALHADDVTEALDAVADAPAARYAVSLAVADRAARREGVPLAESLADDARDAVPVNETVGDADPETTADRAAAAVESGVSCVKLKVGARSLEGDVARVRAVREAVGPAVTIRADANGAWDRETARAAFDAFADLDVASVEQPLPAAALAGHAALRGGPVDVALDESLTEVSVADALDAADVLVLKPMVLGGLDKVRAAATAARAAGATSVVTTTVDALVARLGAVHVAASLGDVPPCGLATADLLAADLGPDPAPVTEGRIRVPAAPGLGVESSEVRPP